MKKIILLVLLVFISVFNLLSQVKDSLQLRINEIEQSLVYIKGAVVLDSGNAVLTVPPSFKFLNRAQSIFVMTKIFNNPIDNSLLGMLVPKNKGILDQNGWVFTINFEALGYVDDSDANEINYSEILSVLKKQVTDENKARQSKGYNTNELIAWASVPFYDHNKKVLHVAKEVRFGKDKFNTLNYTLKIFGRKGIYALNAIANMNQLKEVESLINEVVESIQFLKGNKYVDYQKGIDNSSSYNIGSLITGQLVNESSILKRNNTKWIIFSIAILFISFMLWKYYKNKKLKSK